jgi:hypothetical protein
METLQSLNGSFLRFPGGNNLYASTPFASRQLHPLTYTRGGLYPSGRWRWDKTIGPLESRAGREGSLRGEHSPGRFVTDIRQQVHGVTLIRMPLVGTRLIRSCSGAESLIGCRFARVPRVVRGSRLASHPGCMGRVESYVPEKSGDTC